MTHIDPGAAPGDPPIDPNAPTPSPGNGAAPPTPEDDPPDPAVREIAPPVPADPPWPAVTEKAPPAASPTPVPKEKRAPPPIRFGPPPPKGVAPYTAKASGASAFDVGLVLNIERVANGELVPTPTNELLLMVNAELAVEVANVEGLAEST